MPFLNDIGVRVEEHQGPLWSTFAILADQIERMVALNLAWSLQLVPMLIGLGFHELPWWLRAPLLAYTGLALGPATAALFGMVARAGEGELLTLEVAREVLGALAAPGLTRLVPLYSAFAWLGLAAAISADAGLLALDVLARLAMLLVGLGAIYWGPLLALRPGLSAPRMLSESTRLVWRAPLRALLSLLAILLAVGLGALSVGGLFLIVPVFVALLEVQTYRFVVERAGRPRGRTARR